MPGAAFACCAVACSAGFGGAGPPETALRGAAAADSDLLAPTARALALVARMTLEEKIAQMETDAPAIPRLGIPAYDWWSESLHGVARNGVATVFPQAIGLAASFDEDLLGRVARAIGDEARAKFEAAGGARRGSGRYGGLTFFAPNINVFRDPRWGRGQETYGEDPYLTARMAIAYVRGLQQLTAGDPRRGLRAAAVPKHFAVHSGPELDRHSFDAVVSAHDLADTYLPQFAAVVREARPSGIMAAYNRIDGTPAVANRALLQTWLREQLGFDGFVVGDCGAVGDLVTGHHVAADEAHAAAMAVRAGTDLDCGSSFRHLREAVASGLVTEAEIDRAVVRLFEVRLRLGLFDQARGGVPATSLAGIPPAAHRALAREAAQKSLVLLRNDGTLPIVGDGKPRRIAIIGPLADDANALLGNYHGRAVRPVTAAAGIASAAAARGMKVDIVRGVTLAGHSRAELPAAIRAVRRADLAVAVLGLSPRLEGEEGDPDSANPAGDRRDLNLPGLQGVLLRAALGEGKPTIVVLMGGGALALPQTPRPANAVVMAWYAGEAGGDAIADVLFGVVSPSGRLPVTFYKSADDLPAFDDYRMAGRTYRYFAGAPAYPFGWGLTYAPVEYGGLTATAAPGGGATVHVTVTNSGNLPVDEVIQVYVTPPSRGATDPFRSLAAFRRVSLAPTERRAVDLEVAALAFTRVSSTGARTPVPGAWQVSVGSQRIDFVRAPEAAPQRTDAAAPSPPDAAPAPADPG